MVSLLSDRLVRSAVTGPIKQFVFVSPESVTDGFNELINDINAEVNTLVNVLGVYTVAGLPVGQPEWTIAISSNGRKIGEGPGLGTGVPVYYSQGKWRVFSTDAPVLA